jgi:hypothetical protein
MATTKAKSWIPTAIASRSRYEEADAQSGSAFADARAVSSRAFARASSGQLLTPLPLPSPSGYHRSNEFFYTSLAFESDADGAKMGIVRFLVLLAIVWFGVHWWQGRDSSPAVSEEESPNGFVSVAMPDGTPPNTVVILAPINCPSAAAQRADALAEQLTRRGIPNIRSSHFSASSADPSPEHRSRLDRSVTILNGEVPAVFVNGLAKSNPLADEVISEYARTR